MAFDPTTSSVTVPSTTAPTTFPTLSPNNATTNSSILLNNSTIPATGHSSGLSGGAKAGIGISVTLIVLTLVGILFFIFRNKRRRRQGSTTSSDKTFGVDAEREGSIITALHAKELGIGGRRTTTTRKFRGGRPTIGSPTNFRRPGTANGMPQTADYYGSGHSTPVHSRSMHDLRSYAATPARSRQQSVSSDYHDGLRSHPVTPTYNRSMAAELDKLPTMPLQMFGPAVAKSIARKPVTPTPPRTPTSAPRTPTEFSTPAEFPPMPYAANTTPALPPINTIHRRRGSNGPRLSLVGTMPVPATPVPPTPSTPAVHFGGVNSGETPPGDSPTLGIKGDPSFIASVPPGAALWSHTQKVFGNHGSGFTPTGTPVTVPIGLSFSPTAPKHPTIIEQAHEEHNSERGIIETAEEEAQISHLKDLQNKVIAKKARLIELQKLEDEEAQLSKQIEEAEEMRRKKSQGSLRTVTPAITPKVVGLGLSPTIPTECLHQDRQQF